jgi:DNA-binding phage protein
MSVKISRWDSSEYLHTEEDIRAYLEAVVEEGGMILLPLFMRLA